MRRNVGPMHFVLVSMALLAAGSGATADERVTDYASNAGSTPSETLSIYFEVLKRHDKNPALAIYTPAAREMLESWPMTSPQMENLVHTYSRCNAERAQIDRSRRYAVIRYPIDERQCSPWFFESFDGAWTLDLTMMQRAIRFGSNNAWRFDVGVRHPYQYAFSDWAFDSRGFPQAK
ncbi:MAG: hypothetical protein HKO12_04360 [Woeseiaceae bacterium]|nr:hypothetical protein [Woeseiaceae bacterium]